MSEVFAIAIGGALGTLGRYYLGKIATFAFGASFPWGTLAINVIGSFAIGVVFVLMVEQGQGNATLRSGLMIGLLGAFTIFSTFSLQTLSLVQDDRLLAAGGYIIASVVLSLFAVFISVFAARQISM